MRKMMHEIQNFLENEVNRLFCAVVIFGIIICSMQIYQIKEIQKVQIAIKKTEKKVDFRYFNLVRCLEAIFNIKIDTKTGELKK